MKKHFIIFSLLLTSLYSYASESLVSTIAPEYIVALATFHSDSIFEKNEIVLITTHENDNYRYGKFIEEEISYTYGEPLRRSIIQTHINGSAVLIFNKKVGKLPPDALSLARIHQIVKSVSNQSLTE